MICDTSEVYFPLKYLKDVLPREVFAWSPNGSPITRVCMNSDWNKFIIMHIGMHECYEPKEEDMDKQVYMLQATVKITMLERKKES